MIDVASLSFSYVSELTGDRVEALKDVDLSADAGSLTLVCGASGCGKSTLMKALTGLVPQMTPGELDGVVRINGRNLADVALTDVGHLCSSVFQNPRTQFFCDTVAEELAFCGENYGRERATLRQQSERAAKLMGISHLMERKLTTLSGGQLQKVALACALASGAPVLLADDPTSNLDPAAISEVRAALKVLKEQGLTIVVVEHRLHFLRGLADQVLLMESGRVTRRWNGAEFHQGIDIAADDFDPSLYGMTASYDENGNYIYPEGFDPETNEWKPGYEEQQAAWEAQYAEAQARWEAHKAQVAKALEEEQESGAPAAPAGNTSYSSAPSEASGTLASDEALAALREKLTGN